MPGRHWQLVAFTILTQLVVGLMVVLASGLRLTLGRHDQVELELLTTAVLEILVALLVLGVVVAAIHLGSVGSAIRAFANLRQSWLSREATAGIVFGLLTVAATLAYRLELGSPVARRWCVVAAAVAGLVLVYAMARLYMLRTVPAWNTLATPLTFFSASAILGTAGMTALLVSLSGRLGVARQLLSGVLPWFGWMCLALAAIQITVGSRESGVRRSGLRFLRATLGLGGAGLLLAFALPVFSAATPSPADGVVIAAASALLLVSEVVGRFIFYASYDRIGV
jgi:anaerobic dimethyl sulfoxide reductase subunit C (anchor subunit)